MKKIEIEEYSDYAAYSDICDLMAVAPRNIDEDFYYHWHELLKQQHVLNYDDLEDYTSDEL